MSESDEYPKYKVVYDSFHKEYDLKYQREEGKDWRFVGSYLFKWLAVWNAKRLIKRDERERNRTHTDVWGPYP